MNSGPIGVFDSGIGGLTVLKELVSLLPHEQFLYLGDTARVPYGTRSRDVITTFAKELAEFLLKQKVKALVVACNTISATCIDEIRSLSSIPVIDVIDPTVQYAVKKTKGTIGVIGTPATIKSTIYTKKIHALLPQSKVLSLACPLFVPLTEEGLIDHPVTKRIATEYLSSFKNSPIDTLILGCTHYPLLKKVIHEVLGDGITIIDSAHPTALKLQSVLREQELLSSSQTVRTPTFYFTDVTDREYEIIELFFGHQIQKDAINITALH